MKFDQLKVAEIGTDEWWMTRLAGKLISRYPRLLFLESWQEGNPPIPATTQEETEGMRIMRRMACVNLAPQIVANVRNKMVTEGFRTALAGDENGDTEARRIWKTNDMKETSKTIFDDMLVFGESYAIVGYDKQKDGTKRAIISAEHPRQVITEQHPLYKDKTIAALKIYRNDLLDADFAVLYRLDDNGNPYSRTLFFEGDTKMPSPEETVWGVDGSWEWEEPEELPLSGIPVQRFCGNKGKGIFENHIGSMQMINEGRFQRAYIGLAQAAKQQMLVRPEEPEDTTAGITQYELKNGIVPSEEAAAFKMKEPEDDSLFGSLVGGPGRRWELPYGTKYIESSSTDSRPIDEALKTDIRILGEVSGTLFSLAVSEAVNMSASGANAIKARGQQIAAEERDRNEMSLALVLCYAFEYEGDLQRAELYSIEVIWAKVDDSSVKERAEAAKAAKEAGVPWRSRMEIIMQMNQDQIRVAEQERITEMFNSPTPEATVNDNGSTDTSGS